MEDFVGVIVLIIYLFAAASARKKKGKKQQKRQRAKHSARRADFESAFGSEAHAAAQSPERVHTEAPDGEACEQQRIHLHEVTQKQMHDSAEGEDPCHAGNAPDALEEPVFSYDEEMDTQGTLAQDVLRGVIMSEILTRPCERAAMKRNGRSIK